MLKRISVGALALSGLTAALLTGCSATQVDIVTISPASQTLAVAQTVQFTATGIVGHGQHPSSSENVTDIVTWASSAPAVAVVNSTGMATAVSPGTTTISAAMNGFGGVVTATATLTVTGTGSGGASSTIASLSIIPATQAVSSPGVTTQFLAIGTTSSGATVNLTNQVAWSSSSPQIASIGASTGLATALAQGSVTITAIYSSATTGTAVTGTAIFTITGGASEPITAISIIPGSESLAIAQQGQFLALGTSGTGLLEDVTQSTQLTWSSSIPSIATISSTGLATGIAVGSTAITAEWKNPDGSVVSATENLTVTAVSSTLLSLTIIPNSITVGNLQDSGNFLAIGTFSTSPAVRDLTNSVTWLSSGPNYFPVSTNSNPPNPGAPGGIVTAYASGSAAIIAEATDPVTGSIQAATATFNCPLVLPNPTATPPTIGTCNPETTPAPGLLTTVTVYNEGLNTTNWLVTAPSATGTPHVLHCGPGWAANGNSGGSVCVATYPVGTQVTLTAPAQSGVNFGGWSVNCTPNPNPPTQAGPNQCTMIVTDTNVTVGAIFN
jgi:uncharacterized protein YjdB